MKTRDGTILIEPHDPVARTAEFSAWLEDQGVTPEDTASVEFVPDGDGYTLVVYPTSRIAGHVDELPHGAPS